MLRMLGNQGKLIFLIGLTLTLLAVHFWSQKRINILDYRSSTISQQPLQENNTIAIPFPSSTEKTGFLCQITEQRQESLCNFTFQLAKDAMHGIDISDYTDMYVDIGMTRNGWPVKNLPIRLYLQTYDPSLPEHWQYKIHQIDFDTDQYRHGLALPISYIQVAEWWRKNSQADIKNSVVDLTNVVKLSILTPESAPEGVYQINIRQLSIAGHLIPNSVLFSGLTLIWLLFFLFHVVTFVRHTSKQQQLLREKLIRLSEHSEALHTKATHDSLTHALNRNGGLEKIQKLKLDVTHFCLMYMDLDHFKQLNDQHGHHIGDLVLQEFCSLVRHRLETQGTLIRWGGEEFLAILECRDIASAAAIAQQIRQDLKRHSWPHQQSLTCSIGISVCDINTPFQAAINHADTALYKAKSDGRDRVEVWTLEDKTELDIEHRPVV